MKTQKIRIGITQGDINGIGYEVILKTLLDNRILEICTPVVYGSPKVAAYHRKTLNISDFSFNIIKSPEESKTRQYYQLPQ
jgi:4-hydroxythreonine-4-phosphate dehydrogenase